MSHAGPWRVRTQRATAAHDHRRLPASSGLNTVQQLQRFVGNKATGKILHRLVQRKKPSETELANVKTNPGETEVYDELREQHTFAYGKVKVKGMGVPNADVVAEDDNRFAAVEVKGSEPNWTSVGNMNFESGSHVPAKQIAGAIGDKGKVLRLLERNISERLSTSSLMLSVKGLDDQDAMMAIITKRSTGRNDDPHVVAQHPVTMRHIRTFLREGAASMGVQEQDVSGFATAFIRKVDLLLGREVTAEDDPLGQYERLLPRTARAGSRSILPTDAYAGKVRTMRDLFASEDIRYEQQEPEYPMSAKDFEQYENEQDQVNKLVAHFTQIFEDELPALVNINAATLHEQRSMDVLEAAYNVERLSRDHSILGSGRDPDAVKSLNWMRTTTRKGYGPGEYYIHLQPVTPTLPTPLKT